MLIRLIICPGRGNTSLLQTRVLNSNVQGKKKTVLTVLHDVNPACTHGIVGDTNDADAFSWRQASWQGCQHVPGVDVTPCLLKQS
jgi:hypothetical protein